jgi:molybdopterin synthase sulfur carrier subunit
MIVRYFALLRNITGKQEEQIAAKNVKELLDILILKYGKSFEKEFFEQGKLKRGVNILKNGRNILHINQLDTELESSDVISLFLPLAGG